MDPADKAAGRRHYDEMSTDPDKSRRFVLTAILKRLQNEIYSLYSISLKMLGFRRLGFSADAFEKKEECQPYCEFFLTPPSQKSSRLNPSILKDISRVSAMCYSLNWPVYDH